MLLTIICPVSVLKRYSTIFRENKGIKSVLSHLFKNMSMNSWFPGLFFFFFTITTKLLSRAIHIHYLSFPNLTSTAPSPPQSGCNHQHYTEAAFTKVTTNLLIVKPNRHITSPSYSTSLLLFDAADQFLLKASLYLGFHD